jgi:hypothetical protein
MKVLITIIEQIDKYKRHCLWRGSDINSKKPPKAAWKMVCIPIEGGLGVIDLRVQNEALLLKNLHKFFNKDDLPWFNLVWDNYYRNDRLSNTTKKGSFWWRDLLKLLNTYKGMASPNVRSGSSTFLWDDLWNGFVPKFSFPELYSFARNKCMTLQKASRLPHLHSIFHIPLSDEAFSQFVQLQNLLSSMPASDEHDQWTCIWGPDLLQTKPICI